MKESVVSRFSSAQENPVSIPPVSDTAAHDLPSGERSFASGYNYYKLFWIFFIGCFIGVVLETV
ncbi:MAG: hypothetical protein HFE85_04795, partial [Clostridiales bacterium]|nr:hypothetical protein [Clostridiales bacterium]